MVAWERVRTNKGARTAGVDGQTAFYVQTGLGAEKFLGRLRSQIKDRSFRPQAVRERMIPKAGGKLRRLGIGTGVSYCSSCNRVWGCSRGAPRLCASSGGWQCPRHQDGRGH
jgi:hypothetical protein